MLIPESKTEKEVAAEARCVAWVAKLPEAQKGYFCAHGRYWGFKGALRFMSPCCKTAP